jgi:hypothetical protein
MKDSEMIPPLIDLGRQSYPLSIDQRTAEALVECFSRLMREVPADDQVFVRADYDLATSSLVHPVMEKDF